MKRLIILFGLLLCNASLFSQDCKEIVDPITNEKKAEFEYVFEYGGGMVHIKYEAIKGQYTLDQEFHYIGKLDKTVPAGTNLYLKLENGDIITLKTSKDAVPKVFAGVYVWTRCHYITPLTKEDLDKLAKSPVILVRIPKITEDGHIDIDNNTDKYIKKSKKPYMNGATCISKH